MAPIMEGTHAVLLLYAPIRELSNISLYFPERRAPSFKYKGRASRSASAANDHDWEKKNPAESKQRGQSSDSAGKLSNSQRAAEEAAQELCWLAAEHHQLLVDLLSLCRTCAHKVRMGNQDGKLEDCVDGQEVHPGGQGLCSSSSLLEQRVASKSKKVKKLGGKKVDDAEDLLQSKIKKSVGKRHSFAELPAKSKKTSRTAVCKSESPVRAVSNLPTDEPLIAPTSWDFTEDNQAFDPVMDFCNDFSECDGELGYGSSSCSLMEGLSRRQSESNLRPAKRFDSPLETSSANGSTVKSAQQLYSEINQRSAGVRVVAKVQEVEGTLLRVCRATQIQEHPGLCGSKQEKGPNGNYVSKNRTSRRSEGLHLPLSHTTQPSAPVRFHAKSPSSPSLAGVFNTSYPTSNSLQSMSPVLSPLSSKQVSPHLNHRIVLLSDKDEDLDRDRARNADEAKTFSEVVDKNGNKRTIARLELHASGQPSDSKRNSSSSSTTTGESLEGTLARPLETGLDVSAVCSLSERAFHPASADAGFQRTTKEKGRRSSCRRLSSSMKRHHLPHDFVAGEFNFVTSAASSAFSRRSSSSVCDSCGSGLNWLAGHKLKASQQSCALGERVLRTLLLMVHFPFAWRCGEGRD